MVGRKPLGRWQEKRMSWRHHMTGQSCPECERKEAMPYEIRQSGENYEVINKETQEVKATHTPPDAKEKAEKQVELLNGIEGDWDDHNG
jgi:hypothetical protein